MDGSLKLTTSEISGLWTTYIQNSSVECVLKHFLTYLEDSEIIPIVEESLKLSQFQSEQITKILTAEKLPIPIGFSDADVNLAAPPLFTDLFALSFVYRVGQVTLHQLAENATKVAREDIVAFLCDGQSHLCFTQA